MSAAPSSTWRTAKTATIDARHGTGRYPRGWRRETRHAARIQRLLVTGDNRLKQGVAPAKVRESYEQALAVAREAGLEDAVRPLVELRLADLDAAREPPERIRQQPTAFARLARRPDTRARRAQIMGKLQKYLAEALGTFTLVVHRHDRDPRPRAGDAAPAAVVAIALGFGLALLAGLYAFGEVSGGHFNPAVSIAMFLDQRLVDGRI